MRRLKRKRKWPLSQSQAKRARRSLQAWLKKIRTCRTTPVSARQMRKVRQQLRREQPKLHREMKVDARTKRGLARKLNEARVTWARKLWAGRRKAEGKSTGDRHFQGAFTPSPRRSRKWLKHFLRKSKGRTRTQSPKLKFKGWESTGHPLH